MRVLITGHDGYLGSIVGPFLTAAGHEILGLDTLFFENCTLGEAPPAPRAVRRDLRDVSTADLAGADAVVHLAALSNDPLGEIDPALTDDINFKATVRLAEIAKDAGVRRFLYASSCSMYGAASADEVLDEGAALRPITAYAVSKARAEEGLSRLADSAFSPVHLRNATAYGVSSRFRADIVLNNLVCWAHTTGRIRVMSDGTPWRPIVHAEDIARAFLAALEAPRGAVHDEAFNVGVNGENYQVRELAEIVRDTVPGCVVEYVGPGNPDPRSYRVDFTKIGAKLPAFVPAWNARRGALEIYEAVRAAGVTLEEFQGRKFTRLAQLKHLLATGQLDGRLQWTTVSTPR